MPPQDYASQFGARPAPGSSGHAPGADGGNTPFGFSPVSRGEYGLLLALAAAGGYFGFSGLVPLLALLPVCCAFVLAVAAPGWRSALRDSWLAGGFGFTGACYWVAVPLAQYGGIPWLLALPVPLLLGLALGGYTAVFGLAARHLMRRLPWPLALLGAAAAYACLEYLRGVLFSGFPWASLPSALAATPVAVQLVAFVGREGLSLVLAAAACAAACVYLAHREGEPIRARLALTLLLLLLPYLVGVAVLPRATEAQTENAIRMRLVQGNIDQSLKWEPAYQTATVERYETLSLNGLAGMAETPELILWPETTLPFYFQEVSDLSNRVRAIAKQTGSHLLVGSPGYERIGEGNDPEKDYELFNRVFLLGPLGFVRATYDKQHLVPFGEYMPLKRILPFMKKLTAGAIDFTPGRNHAPLTLDLPGRRTPVALGLLICYEAIFPELIQDRVAHGATVLVNVSNDAWFGQTAAPHQHLALAVLGAVEQGRPLVRATNTGISCLVDRFGRVETRTELFQAAVLDVSVSPRARTTPYHRLRSLVLGAILLTVLVILGLALRSKPKPRS